MQDKPGQGRWKCRKGVWTGRVSDLWKGLLLGAAGWSRGDSSCTWGPSWAARCSSPVRSCHFALREGYASLNSLGSSFWKSRNLSGLRSPLLRVCWKSFQLLWRISPLVKSILTTVREAVRKALRKMVLRTLLAYSMPFILDQWKMIERSNPRDPLW